MRTAGLLAGIACATALWSSAGAAEVRYLGAFTVTSAKNCIARYVGETFSSSFRPGNIGDNPNFTSLSMLNPYSGDIYETAPTVGLPPKVWTDVTVHGFTNVHYSFNTRMILRSQMPATITPTTNFVELTGLIEKMGGDPGLNGTCVAGFRGSYFRRVE